MYAASRFLEMFPDNGQSFSGLKHLTEKWQQWHHWLVCGLWLTTVHKNYWIS